MDAGFAPSDIDTSRPHPARMYDFYLGGKDNYPVDREAAAAVLRAVPEVRAIARANRAFLQRAVRFLAAEAGIGQFLDIGTGIPAAGNVHEVAQRAAPGARVVYVDNDPIVHVHASALLTGEGDTGIVLADLREPETILAHPQVRAMIDFTEPAALLLVAIVHFLTNSEDPAAVIGVLRDGLAPGSFVVLSHGTSDFHPPATVGLAAAAYERATAPLVLRSRAQVVRFFEGLELVEPGLVQVPLWRPDGNPPRDLRKIAIYGGVGRKPQAAP
jgi:SAM-dependent methyltransferase